jgi:predicted ATP-dependent endonuclease of OLD family
MLFLKEQSRHKQIIITTHSPQVLDILNKDELGNIIIASYEKGEGTKLRHLDEKEIAKAQQYMEEDYLSDYWRFSDLEKEKIQAAL